MPHKAILAFGVLFSLPLLVWSSIDPQSPLAADAYPALLGFPLFLCMGAPWRLKSEVGPLAFHRIAWCALGMLAGLVSGLTILFAAAWTVLLWMLVEAFIQPDSDRRLQRLLLIPLFSFPWVLLDAQPLSWFFRVTGAWAAESLLGAAGFEVARESTMLFVDDICISVGEGCAGISTLQSMLLGGTILAYAMMHAHRRFWWHVPILLAAAWLANTARVAMTGMVALSWGPAYAEGTFHEWEGLAVLVAMFAICAGVFALLRSSPAQPDDASSPEAAA